MRPRARGQLCGSRWRCSGAPLADSLKLLSDPVPSSLQHILCGQNENTNMLAAAAAAAAACCHCRCRCHRAQGGVCCIRTTGGADAERPTALLAPPAGTGTALLQNCDVWLQPKLQQAADRAHFAAWASLQSPTPMRTANCRKGGAQRCPWGTGGRNPGHGASRNARKPGPLACPGLFRLSRVCLGGA